MSEEEKEAEVSFPDENSRQYVKRRVSLYTTTHKHLNKKVKQRVYCTLCVGC